MDSMFNNATVFNNGGSNTIKDWITTSVTDMDYMFSGAKAFNQPIGWNTANVITMYSMFNGATIFNQDIHKWDIGKVSPQPPIKFSSDSPLATVNQPNWTIPPAGVISTKSPIDSQTTLPDSYVDTTTTPPIVTLTTTLLTKATYLNTYTYTTNTPITFTNYVSSGTKTTFGDMFGYGVNPMYVSLFQMYIEIYSPKIEFLNDVSSVIYTYQTTGNYFGNSLKTFRIQNIDMALVNQVRISSTSTINPNVIVYGAQLSSYSSYNYLLYNIGYASRPLEIFNNSVAPTPTTSILNYTTSISSVNTSINYSSFPLVNNYIPYYVKIPSIVFSGIKGATLQFTFNL
jgi:hypothetical protein